MTDTIARTVRRITDAAHAAELEQLAGGFAQELNQSLGAIAAFAQAGWRVLSVPGPPIAQAAEIFREITRVALSAGTDVRRIRTLYALAAPAVSGCRMHDVIGEIEPLLGLIALQNGGRLDIDEQPSLPEVRVERPQIQCVLLCLTRNAFDAAAALRDPALVQIRTCRADGDVETSVIDTGSGVPAASQAELFQPFFTTKDRGTGLSLASSRSIIEAHGGSIGFERMGSGASRFWFRLPAAAAIYGAPPNQA